MNTDPHYSRYTNAELLDVKQHIDRDKHPNRAAKVDAELAKRRQQGRISDEERSVSADDTSEERWELLLDFQEPEQQIKRWLFIIAFIALHLLVLSHIYRQTTVPDYQTLPEYLINVENAQCRVVNNDGHRYYDLFVKSYGHQFVAVDIRRNLCQKLAREIPTQVDVKIRHLDGVIFNLSLNDTPLLSYRYLSEHYRDNRLEHYQHWLFFALVFWSWVYKSIINALRPGTFSKEGE